jgi:predicted aldo/keto reductase-like oxidoreductase
MTTTPTGNREPLICRNETLRYRPLGKTGLNVSALSFGCMRLADDVPLNTKLISRAIDLGVNYFETTRYYLNGTCQHRTAPGLVGKTAGVIVSGKDGIDENKTGDMFRRELEQQLQILGLSHFKFYQVGWFSWAKMPYLLKRGGVLDALRKAQDEGLVHHIGFTGHDSPPNFIQCIETGIFDSLTVPYSLMNRTYEPTIKRAGELGVGVVAMCPVGGGVLAAGSDKIRKALNLDMPTPAMALRFVLSNPNVSTACSGMNTMEQLEENVKTVHAFDPARDGAHEEMCAGLDRLREALGNRICTACRYCQPCPQGVDIPRYMEFYRLWKCFGLEDHVRSNLKEIKAENRLDRCNECGQCEDKCPTHLPVRETLKEIKTLDFQRLAK